MIHVCAMAEDIYENVNNSLYRKGGLHTSLVFQGISSAVTFMTQNFGPEGKTHGTGQMVMMLFTEVRMV